MNQIIHADCMDWLDLQLGKARYRALFMDPPDNLGLNYAGYIDKLPPDKYYAWIETLTVKAMGVAEIVWISYYWEHDLEIKYRVRNLLKHRHPLWEHRQFLWRFTFSQHNKHDCAVGFRYILRLSAPGVKFNVNEIRVESMRQIIGDSRANPEGRVPDSVWDHSRVVGNANERRDWHPTQHPEALMKRLIAMSIVDKVNNVFVDLFLGSGTSLRACKDLGINSIGIEQSDEYVRRLELEHGIKATGL